MLCAYMQDAGYPGVRTANYCLGEIVRGTTWIRTMQDLSVSIDTEWIRKRVMSCCVSCAIWCMTVSLGDGSFAFSSPFGLPETHGDDAVQMMTERPPATKMTALAGKDGNNAWTEGRAKCFTGANLGSCAS